MSDVCVVCPTHARTFIHPLMSVIWHTPNLTHSLRSAHAPSLHHTAHRCIVKGRPPEGRVNTATPWSLSWPQFEAVIATLVADDVTTETAGRAAERLADYLCDRGSGGGEGGVGGAVIVVPHATRFVRRFCHFFERCGCVRFATEMATMPSTDIAVVRATIRGMSAAEVAEAASFHGDIGESPATLDPMARAEQSGASGGAAALLAELRALGGEYIERHGVKFLVSAKGKTADELMAILKVCVCVCE
jgi:hypothetical protein